MNLNLNGKIAIVIASSQGLGKAIAAQLVKEGANVMLASRNEAKLMKVREELTQLEKGRVSHIVTDITNSEDIKALVQYTIKEFGSIDILVNNAGGPPSGSLLELDDKAWQDAFELNLLSYVRMIRCTIPFMQKNGGKIINIASSSIKQPIPGLILSNTFRLGIVGLTKTLAEELAASNIIVNTVAPGRIATDRVAKLDLIKANKLGISQKDIEKQSQANIPLKRYGKPEEFANFVTYLSSDVNSYMTGQSFLVDGGMVKGI
ncbi:SDR family oxidoreductase [Robertmurraya massiliosenegalensis]|uniref:SDR family oxidoreductase n=1 Tax=Robertmurraya TaxID=2837507 RepID=UPI0039A59B29